MSISAYCRNRQTFINFLSFIPKIRNEIQSPYPAYTQEQLNMRRKVEILKYINNNQHNTQTGNITKNQRWANLSRNSTRVQNLVACPKINRPTPTSSSDIPGPIIDLYLDNSVPLYLYSKPQNLKLPQAPVVNSATIPFTVNADTDIQSPNNIAFTTGSLICVYPDDDFATFEVQIPLSIQIAGNIMPPTSLYTVSAIQVNISNITCSVYYFDSSMSSYQYIDSSLLESTIVDIDISNSSVGEFSASQYIGNLVLSGITLNTQAGYVYNFVVQCDMNYTLLNQNNNSLALSGSNVNSIQLYTTTNLTGVMDPYYSFSDNCVISSSPTAVFQPFSLVQIG